MTPSFFTRFLVSREYETRIERAVLAPDDLYDLDGETFLRRRDGRIETGDADLLQGGE